MKETQQHASSVVGLPASGKTTLFNLLTGSTWSDAGGNGGFSPVLPLKWNSVWLRCLIREFSSLSDFYKPKKTTYAQIEVSDVPGISPSGNGAGGEMTRFLSYLASC